MSKILDAFKRANKVLDISDTQDAEYLIASMDRMVKEVFEKAGTGNLLFATHGYSHSENMADYFSEYLAGFTGKNYIIPLKNEPEKLYFLVLVFSAILYHDIGMSNVSEDELSRPSAETIATQNRRFDHDIKSLYALTKYYDDKKSFPVDGWNNFFSKYSNIFGRNGSRAFKCLLRICKAHGDKKDWLKEYGLMNLSLTDDEINKLGDKSFKNKLVRIYNNKNEFKFFSDIFFSNHVNIFEGMGKDESRNKILKFSAAFLCLLDLIDVGNRVNYEVIDASVPIKELLILASTEIKEESCMHWLVDCFVANNYIEHDDNNKKFTIVINVNTLPEIVSEQSIDILKFVTNNGALYNIKKYRKHENLLSALEEWHYADIRIVKSTNLANEKLKDILDLFWSILPNYTQGNKNETDTRNYLLELWRRYSNISDLEHISQIIFHYFLISRTLKLENVIRTNNPKLSFVDFIFCMMKYCFPVERLISDNEKRTFNNSHYYFINSDNIIFSFIGALNIAKIIYSENNKEDIANSSRIYWVEKGNKKSKFGYLANLIEPKATDKNIYLAFCHDDEALRKVLSVFGRSCPNAFFILFGNYNEKYLEAFGCEKITYSASASIKEKKEEMIEFANIFLNAKQLPLEELLTIENFTEFLNNIKYTCNGLTSVSNDIIQCIENNELGKLVLLEIILIFSKVCQNNDILQISSKFAKRCYYELTFFLFPKLHDFKDSSFASFEEVLENISIIKDFNSSEANLFFKDIEAIYNKIVEECKENTRNYNLIRQIQIFSLLWVRDFSKLNLSSSVFDELISVIPIDSIIEFVKNNKNLLPDRNTLAIIALHAKRLSSSNDEDTRYFEKSKQYIMKIVKEFLQVSGDLCDVYDFIIFQALYRLIEILIGLNEKDFLLELYDQCIKDKLSPLYFLADLEVLCSARNDSVLQLIDDRLEKIKKSKEEYPTIYKFAFDIVFHYGTYASDKFVKIEERFSFFQDDFVRLQEICIKSRINDAPKNSDKEISDWAELRKIFLDVQQTLLYGIPSRTEAKKSKMNKEKIINGIK